MLKPILSVLLCLSTSAALATDDPYEQTDGLYVGHEIGKPAQRVTIELRGSSLVILDREAIGAMAVDRWEIAAAGGKSGDLQWKATGTPKLVATRAGKTRPPPKGTSALRLRLWPTRQEAVLCMTEPGSKVVKIDRVPVPETTTPSPAGVTCYALTQLVAPAQVVTPVPEPGPDFECMRECRQQNMARAVGPEEIEADCRAVCLPK